MKLLAVDTSTHTEGVAALDGDTVRAVIHTTGPKTHAKRLMTTVDTVLKLADMTLDDFDGFAVTTGPGSFTGLRIGISAVKGFAVATAKPVAGVSTLEALARQFPGFPGKICPVLDARKGQIYSALYRFGEKGDRRVLKSPCVVDPETWLQAVDPPCLFVGDGLLVYRDLVVEKLGDAAQFAPPCLNSLNACVIGQMGMKEIALGNAVDVNRLSPQYIRKSDAEIKLEKAQVGASSRQPS